ncbi:MAG: transposase [Rhodoferax sp.]|nr:transposase [Rhodoferax sp.]
MDTPHIAAKSTKRRHNPAFKRKLVELTRQAGASVAAIALEHGINANLLFKWRREQLGSPSSARPPAQAILLPVTMVPVPPVRTMSTPPPAVMANATRACAVGVIEIEVGGARVRLCGSVDQDSVRCVLQTLRDAT